MAIFRYKAADKTGKIAEISIEAENSQEALRRLRARGMNPLEILGEGGSSGKRGIFQKKANFNIYQFIDRLVPLLKAHIQDRKSVV